MAAIYDVTWQELERVPVEWVNGHWHMTREPTSPIDGGWHIVWPDPPDGL